MGNEIEVKWSDFYELNVSKVNDNVPDKTGVYIIWLKVKGEKWVCCYVGESLNLKETILGHLSPEEKNRCIRKHVKKKHALGLEYSEVEDQERRSGILKYLYDRFKPECNPEDPSGSPINVYLPHDREIWRERAKKELKEMEEPK